MAKSSKQYDKITSNTNLRILMIIYKYRYVRYGLLVTGLKQELKTRTLNSQFDKEGA
jgi:hypothetical protein